MENERKEKWYRVKDAAVIAGVPIATLTNAIRRGKLIAKQIPDSSRHGYHYLISESGLLEWDDDRKSVKANTLPRKLNEYTIEDIASELNRRLSLAYETGVRDGIKKAKSELMAKLREVK